MQTRDARRLRDFPPCSPGEALSHGFWFRAPDTHLAFYITTVSRFGWLRRSACRVGSTHNPVRDSEQLESRPSSTAFCNAWCGRSGCHCVIFAFICVSGTRKCRHLGSHIAIRPLPLFASGYSKLLIFHSLHYPVHLLSFRTYTCRRTWRAQWWLRQVYMRQRYRPGESLFPCASFWRLWHCR